MIKIAVVETNDVEIMIEDNPQESIDKREESTC